MNKYLYFVPIYIEKSNQTGAFVLKKYQKLFKFDMLLY